MRKILKSKCFILILFLFSLICFSSSKVSATNDKYFFYEEQIYYYNLPEGCQNYIIAYDSNNTFFIFYTKDKNGVFNYGTRGGFPSVQYYTDKSYSTTKEYYRNYYKLSPITREDGTLFLDFANCNSLRPYDTYSNCLGLIHSSVDIYDMSDSNKVVFQGPPVGTLAKVVTLEEAKEIPITIVGLAKSLIPLLICLISFWKGWQILSRILHRA